MNADRRQHQRHGEPHPEDVDPEVATAHVAEEARHDPPAAEGLAVGSHRIFRTGSPGQVIVGRRIQDGLGLAIEFLEGNRLFGSPPGHPRLVDFHLPKQAQGWFLTSVCHGGCSQNGRTVRTFAQDCRHRIHYNQFQALSDSRGTTPSDRDEPMSTVDEKTYTPEDLLAMPDGKSYELVDGHLEERNMSVLSSWVGSRLYRFIDIFVEENQLGWSWHADLGFVCFPDAPGKVRRPDVSFVRKDRLPEGLTSEGYLYIHPDLAVEVISPNDLAYKVDSKVVEYLDAGVPLIWVVNPEARAVRIHRHDRSVSWLREADELSGEDVLPGFHCRVSAPVSREATRTASLVVRLTPCHRHPETAALVGSIATPTQAESLDSQRRVVPGVAHRPGGNPKLEADPKGPSDNFSYLRGGW